MLEVLSDARHIARAQKLFQKKLKPYVNEKMHVTIGFQGDSVYLPVAWSEELNMWMCFNSVGTHYWNAFGVNKPKPDANMSITCEINSPFAGIDRRIGGVFVRDSETNQLFLMHRGRIGGSKKGIGKALFQSMYSGEWQSDVLDGVRGTKEVASRLALIAAFDSPRFALQVSQFVHGIRKMKDFVADPSFDEEWDADEFGDFSPEFSGSKQPYTHANIVEAECDHGIVVNTLHERLQDLGFSVTNDQHRDLFILDEKNAIVAVFEVKTDVTTSSLYKAVGQLMLNNADLATEPKLYIVIPECTENLRRQFKKLDIQVITYGWEGNTVVFNGIPSHSALKQK